MRRRYVIKENELVEVFVDNQVRRVAIVGDRHYDGLRASDGTPIDTRTKHRAYMKLKGLTTADDYTNEWQKAKEKREDFYTTGGDHAARREALERAMYKRR